MITTDQFVVAYENDFSTTIRFLLSRGAVGQDAEELAQDAWGKGWIRRDSLRNPSSIVPWVNSIALNLFRSRVSRELPSGTTPDPAIEPRHAATIDARNVMFRCSSEERALLEATAKGYTSSEIAHQLLCSPTTVRVRLLRLRRRLRHQLGAGSAAN